MSGVPLTSVSDTRARRNRQRLDRPSSGWDLRLGSSFGTPQDFDGLGEHRVIDRLWRIRRFIRSAVEHERNHVIGDDESWKPLFSFRFLCDLNVSHR